MDATNSLAHTGLRGNKEALRKPLKGAAENVVQLADHQCAFRAQAGNSPL